MSEETNLTKFDTLIENNQLIDTDLIYLDVMNILQIEDIEFNELTIYNNTIKYNRNIEFLISTLTNGNEKITIQFSNCIFNSKIRFLNKLDFSFIFVECEFNSVQFHNIKINEHPNYKDYQSNFEFIMVKIKESLIINDCKFSGKFYINNQKNVNHTIKINNVSIKESTFNENFKLHNCIIDNMELKGVDFQKNADFFKSNFEEECKENNKKIVFNGMNVKGITIFEECKFHNKFIIQYATLSGLVQFRSAKFFKGFNIDKTNTEKEINFYNVKGLEKNTKDNDTSQETYRIIKHNCEKTGNIIDANHYHALELEKRKEYLNGRNARWPDKIIFNANWITSRFGTNWIYPLLGISIVGLLTLIILHHARLPELYNSIDLINGKILWSGLDKAFEYMYILNKDKQFEDYGFIFLLNKISLGYLYYQFVTAVRKDTRK